MTAKRNDKPFKATKQVFSEGTVIKIISNRYTVLSDGKAYIAYPRGRLKLDGDIFAGDKVLIETGGQNSAIEKVLPRKTLLKRPYVANVDTLIIVIAPEPEPDFLLVDKLLICCFREGIKPVLCINKSDVASANFVESIFSAYKDVCKCVSVSASVPASLSVLEEEISGKLVSFAGQSAVGKTSILNTLLENNLPTGELSKIKRGRNTTRHVEIYSALGGSIVDTCGFSVLEIDDLKPEELRFYYDEYVALQNKCAVNRCEHVSEADCAVRAAAESGTLDKGRYERYTEIYNELKEARLKKYGQYVNISVDTVR